MQMPHPLKHLMTFMIKHELRCEAPKVVSTRAAGSPEAVHGVLFRALSDRKYLEGQDPQQPSCTAMICNSNSAHVERFIERDDDPFKQDKSKHVNKSGILCPKRVTQPSECQTKLNKDWHLSGDN